MRYCQLTSMGQPKRSNPQHPVNRSRLIHAAWLRLHEPGYLVPIETWRRSIIKATGVGSRQAAHIYTQLMEDLGMVRLHDGKGIELRPSENVLLPD